MKKIATLCLAMGVCGVASADSFQLTITPTQNLTYGMLAVGFRDTVNGTWPTFEDVDLVPLVNGSNQPLSFAANQQTSLTVNVPNAFGLTMDYYSFVASYTDNLNLTHATVAFSQSVGPSKIGNPWPFFPTENNFLGLGPTPAYITNWDIEQIQIMPSMILSAEEASTPAWLTSKWSVYGTPRPISGIDCPVVGQSGYLVNFSSGTNGGSIHLAAVPEPASFLG